MSKKNWSIVYRPGRPSVGETTLLSPHRQTDTDKMSETYLSIRITVPHDDEAKVVGCLHDYDWCLYKHGNGTSNEHYHVCIAEGGQDASDAIRLRLKRAWPDRRGNKFFSIKSFDNGLRSFVFYCHHENTTPIFAEEKWQAIIDDVVSKGYYKKKRVDEHFPPADKEVKRKERDWEISYTNLVPQCVHHRSRKGLATECLKEVAQDLFQTTKWKPSKYMRCNGVPYQYQEDFEFRIGKRTKYPMDWWKPKEERY